MIQQEENKIIIESYKGIVNFIGEIYGDSCEVVLHSVENNKSTIVALKNGGKDRKIGQPIDEIGERLRNLCKDTDYIINNYKTGYNGLEIRSNSYYIKNTIGEIIGILCVNFDATIPMAAHKYLSGILGLEKEPPQKQSTTEKVSIKDLTKSIIDDVIKEVSIPPERMNLDERVEVLKILKKKGVFRIKGAVKVVAKELKTSEPSIYRYLKEIE